MSSSSPVRGTEPSGRTRQRTARRPSSGEGRLALHAQIAPRDRRPSRFRGLGRLLDGGARHGARLASGQRLLIQRVVVGDERLGDGADEPPSGTELSPPAMRRATVTAPSARSRGPISTRTGMPLISASMARLPKALFRGHRAQRAPRRR